VQKNRKDKTTLLQPSSKANINTSNKQTSIHSTQQHNHNKPENNENQPLNKYQPKSKTQSTNKPQKTTKTK